MTIGTQTPRVEYVEDGATLLFAVPFAFFDHADLEVTRFTSIADSGAHPLTLNVDYTVAGGDTGDGPAVGSITLLTASVAAATLRIDRHTKRSQELHYTPGDDFPARDHEDGLDRLEAQVQEIDLQTLSAEEIMDLIAGMLRGGPGISIVYDDLNNTLTISATGVTDLLANLPDMVELSGDEQTFNGSSGSPGPGGLTTADVEAIVGAMIVAGAGITATYDALTEKITIVNTAGGGGAGALPALLNDLVAVGMGSNEIWVGTGPGTVELLPISVYMQGLLATADVVGLRAAIGALTIAASSLGNPGFIKLSNNFKIQWGQITVPGNGTPTTNYPSAYTSFSIPVGSGGNAGTTNPNNCRVTAASPTGFTVTNNDPNPATFFWIAVGV